MDLRSGQNKHQMLRRLLHNFQKGVESGVREHMDFVDNIDPFFHLGRGIDRLAPQRPHLVHAAVGSRVQLQHVHGTAPLNARTGRAHAAGVPVHRMLAVHCPGQNLGAGGLPRAPGACEEVGVGDASLRCLPPERLCNMGLSDHVGKDLRTPFPIERLIHRTPPVLAV